METLAEMNERIMNDDKHPLHRDLVKMKSISDKHKLNLCYIYRNPFGESYSIDDVITFFDIDGNQIKCHRKCITDAVRDYRHKIKKEELNSLNRSELNFRMGTGCG